MHYKQFPFTRTSVYKPCVYMFSFVKLTMVIINKKDANGVLLNILETLAEAAMSIRRPSLAGGRHPRRWAVVGIGQE